MKVKKIISVFGTLLLLSSCSTSSDLIDLQGDWKIELDRKAKGVSEKWFEGHEYSSTINLPSTTDMAGFGNEAPETDINSQWTFGWRRKKVYAGVAWYEKDVNIPANWEGKHIELYLEQLRSESTIWVDGVKVPHTEISLATSHRHDLSDYLTPGKHRITIKLDNHDMRGIGGSYIRSEMGQGNWQGIVGDIQLQATDPIWIDHVRFETVNEKQGKVDVVVGNRTGSNAVVQGVAALYDGKRVVTESPFSLEVNGSSSTGSCSLDISELDFWSEFNPQLYDLKLKIESEGYADEYSERTGLRIISQNANKQITVNGVTTFLRGTVNYNIFPLTGYPSTNVEDWLRIFRICQDWGMNHIRFHSLTPPLAAFEAADQLGVYLQCECPKAGIVGSVVENDEFQISEGLKILRDYGNHPSFIMMSMGNELAGNNSAIDRVYRTVSESDNRRLFTSTTGGQIERPIGGDYRVYGTVVRGFEGPQTDWDYKNTIDGFDRTIISHETGQWHCYPSMKIIPKYNGAMQPDNLLIIKKDLEKKGMLDMAETFTQVTGKFASILYKEELEAITRTPGIGGYQMHNLNDFPAQGTATSGLLDIFYDEKGYITGKEFKEVVAPVVPLARMPKRVYTNDEIFSAGIDLSNYLEKPIQNGKLRWSISSPEKVCFQGEITKPVFQNGNVYPIGEISVPLTSIKKAAKMELCVEVEGTEYRNRWNFWVYPDNHKAEINSDIKVAHKWNEAKSWLETGNKVLFLPDASELKRWRPGQFKTVFWSPVWLMRGIETMSVMADVSHPALSQYPTDIYTDWQWFDVLEHSFVMGMDDLPVGFKPIVYVIDSYRKNERLANLMEAKVGKGRLLISSIDFENGLDTDIARMNLRTSVLDYMASEEFNPKQSVEIDALDRMFKPEVKRSRTPFPEIADAVLHVKAESPKLPSDSKYSYKVSAPIVHSGEITGWVDKRDIWITLRCPESTDGTLYLFMRNSRSKQWGFLKTPQEKIGVDYVEETNVGYGNKNIGPVTSFLINDEYLETIYDFGVTGKWFALPIKAEQMQNGKLALQISTLNVPNIVTEIAFVPKK